MLMHEKLAGSKAVSADLPFGPGPDYTRLFLSILANFLPENLPEDFFTIASAGCGLRVADQMRNASHALKVSLPWCSLPKAIREETDLPQVFFAACYSMKRDFGCLDVQTT